MVEDGARVKRIQDRLDGKPRDYGRTQSLPDISENSRYERESTMNFDTITKKTRAVSVREVKTEYHPEPASPTDSIDRKLRSIDNKFERSAQNKKGRLDRVKSELQIRNA